MYKKDLTNKNELKMAKFGKNVIKLNSKYNFHRNMIIMINPPKSTILQTNLQNIVMFQLFRENFDSRMCDFNGVSLEKLSLTR